MIFRHSLQQPTIKISLHNNSITWNRSINLKCKFKLIPFRSQDFNSLSFRWSVQMRLSSLAFLGALLRDLSNDETLLQNRCYKLKERKEISFSNNQIKNQFRLMEGDRATFVPWQRPHSIRRKCVLEIHNRFLSTLVQMANVQ